MSRLLLLWALLTPGLARADVVSDESCHAWEHWRGGHEGECRIGPRCSASTPSAGDRAAVVPVLVLAGALALRRARRRAQYSSPQVRDQVRQIRGAMLRCSSVTCNSTLPRRASLGLRLLAPGHELAARCTQ